MVRGDFSLKRITIWLDCGNEKAEIVRREIENFLKTLHIVYTVVDECELASVTSQK
jgi:hypothetical protein